jgi:hypothetical protein
MNAGRAALGLADVGKQVLRSSQRIHEALSSNTGREPVEIVARPRKERSYRLRGLARCLGSSVDAAWSGGESCKSGTGEAKDATMIV